MGASIGRTDPSVEELLFDRGYDFDFFQAVRLLALIFPERELVGGDGKPSREVARFGAALSLSFPSSQIERIHRPTGDGSPATMTVAFLGLTGPQGVLPSPYTELLLARRSAKDTALAAFFDLFNHRLLSLFYRAWEKHHFVIEHERSARSGQDDSFTGYLFDLIGMGTPGLRGRLRFCDHALLRYAGLIAQRPHSASALGGLLRDYFSVPVEIDQFQGRWLKLDQRSLSWLSEQGPQNQLGVGAIAGDAVWNQQAGLRVRLGPLGLDRFMDFLPDGKAFTLLVEWTRFFAGLAFAFDLQLVLRAEEVPRFCLSDEGEDAPRLGWLGWLKTEPFLIDPDDAVFVAEIGEHGSVEALATSDAA